MIDDPTEKTAQHAPVYWDLEAKKLGLQLANVGLGSIDFLADTIVLDQMAADILGLPANREMPRAAAHDRIHPEDRPSVDHEITKLQDPKQSDFFEIVHRLAGPDSNARWVKIRKLGRFETVNGTKRLATGYVAIQDITTERRAQRMSELLAQEYRHRAKNIVTMMGVISRVIMATGKPENFIDRLMPRLSLLAQNQDNEGHASGDLEETIRTCIAPFRAGKPAQSLDISGPRIKLSNDQAQTFMLLINELGTNAMKHGAWASQSGAVTVNWDIADDETLHFRWIESGGQDVQAPESVGFGSKILGEYTQIMLGGEVDITYQPTGLAYRVAFPLGARDDATP